MEAHRVGEADFEQAVVARGDGAQDFGECVALGGGELVDGSHVTARDHHQLEGPHCPEWDDTQERIVLIDYAEFGVRFNAGIIAEDTGGSGSERFLFLGDFIGQAMARPDLAVRVGIAAAHHGATVFEDLDIVDERVGAELGVLIDPRVDDSAHGGLIHFGEREVVARREADDAADAGLGFGDEEAAGFDVLGGGVGFECGEIVIEHEGPGVLRIVLAAGAGVAGAEIAGGVVIGKLLRWSVFDLALPGTVGAVGRYQDPLASQRIVAAVRVGLPVEHLVLW
jgi:hypothetical protein